MSLSRAQNIFKPTNINSIVILLLLIGPRLLTAKICIVTTLTLTQALTLTLNNIVSA